MQFKNTERGDLSNTRPLLWFFGLTENKATTFGRLRTGLFSVYDKLGGSVSHQIHHLIPPDMNMNIEETPQGRRLLFG